MGSSVVSSSNFQQLMFPGLRKVFYEAYDEVPEQFPQVYNVLNSRQAKESDFQIAGTGAWEEKESMGSVSYDSIDPSFEISYTHTEYAKGIQIERKFRDDEKYGVMNKLSANLARKGRVLVETNAAAVFNTSITVNGYDGKPLVADDHPLKKSASVGDNKTTGALSDTTLKAALLLARKGQLDDVGDKLVKNWKNLIIPPDLEFTALTILHSSQTAGTANNDINVIKSRLNPVVLDYLTSATAYWLQASDHEMNFFWRVKPEFNQEENFDTMVAKYIGYMRCTQGYSDWRGIVGSTGA